MLENYTMSTDIQYYQILIKAVELRDSAEVRKILDENVVITSGSNILKLVCSSKKVTDNIIDIDYTEKERDIIYMLVDYGCDLEEIDEKGNTPLFHAVHGSHSDLCEILLQCGADMWSNTEFQIPVLDYVLQTSSDSLRNVFDKFYPGLFKAVEWEDICQVRKLINLWCRTDLCKEGITLKDAALKTGHEEIISLILGISGTMKLIYHIMAKNINSVRELLEKSHQKLCLDLRKMSDKGSPILYYLIKSADIAAVHLFVKYGCHLYTIMQDGSGFDMPVLFSALKANTSLDIIEALLPPGKLHQEEIMFKILYRGKTILEVALEENVTQDVFSVLIDRGGPRLLCERNQMNQTVRDLALNLNEIRYVNVIDKIVLSWILHPYKYPDRRQKLALYGWDLGVMSAHHNLPENSDATDYFFYAENLQRGIKHLSKAVEFGDMKKYHLFKVSLAAFEAPEQFLWFGKIVGDGMPLLHKAVLHNRLEIVNDILLEKPEHESIDNLFDQNRRTALHYAYANSEVKEIKYLLMSYGCSEHVLDKTNREPLDFRDKQDSPLLLELLNRLKSNEFHEPESDPWSTQSDYENPFQDSAYTCSQATKQIFDKELCQDSDNETASQYSNEEIEERQSICLIS